MSNTNNAHLIMQKEQNTGSYGKLLKRFPFVAYLISLFLGAFNDNAYKTVVMLIALSQLDTGYVDSYFIGAQFVFILPFLLFAGYAGYLSDIYSKTKVFIATKFVEVFIMLLVLYFLPSLNKTALISILFLLSAQSVFFSPAKYGILPEIFDESQISRANGLLELSTFVSIILGTAFGGILMQYFSESYIVIALFLLVLSIMGFGLSLFIPKVAASGSSKKFNFNPWHEVKLGVKEMKKNNILTLSILGISLFFAIAFALTTNLLVFGKEILHLENYQLGILNALIGLGIGIGSFLAGWLSGDKIEYGLIPFGLLGIATCCFWVGFITNIYYVCMILFLDGIMAGIFVVPLHALLQEIPHKTIKGRLISTNNFFNGVGMIMAILLLWFLQLTLSADYIMVIFSFILFGFNIIAFLISPLFYVRFLLWVLVHTLYKVKVQGKFEIPYKGPAVIVANKVSVLDGLLISIALPRFVRYFVPENVYNNPFFKLIFKFVKAIPYDANNKENFISSASKAREALVQGHLVCIFKDENLDIPKSDIPFELFYDSVVTDLDVPVFPIYICQPWNGILSYNNNGKVRLTVPEQFPVQVTLHLGPKLEATNTTSEDIQKELQHLRYKVLSHEKITTTKTSSYIENNLATEFVKTATTYPFKTAVVDDLGNNISYHKLCNYVLAMSDYLKSNYDFNTNKTVAIIMPNCFLSILCNISLTFAGFQVINLDSDNLELIKKYNVKNIFTLDWYRTSLEIDRDINLVNFENCFKKITSYNFSKINIIKYLLPAKFIVKKYGKFILELDHKVSNFNEIEITQSYIKNNLFVTKNFLSIRKNDNVLSITPYSNIDSYITTFWMPIIVGSTVITYSNPNINNLNLLNTYLSNKNTTVLVDFSDNLKKYINFSYTTLQKMRLIIAITKFAKLDTGFNDKFKANFKNVNLSISVYSDEQGMLLLSYKNNNDNFYECSLISL